MSSLFLMNLLLAGIWLALSSEVTFLNVAMGLIIGALLIALYTRALGRDNYLLKLIRFLLYSIYFLKILIKVNFQVAYEVITPGYKMSPRIIRYPVEGLTDIQITTLANSITLTPGTLSADVDDNDPNGKCLYIHCMYAQDRKEAISELDELKTRMLWEVFGVPEHEQPKSS
ncbi:Na(+)/H(+) antiporter subunit E1 [Poriferisphaera corsica]|uniref:Na(+)/H(+) antiporter subunit E1 n=1 Tax=Poriferisphaera corsica TaxID=2528020 RepID=A0A517YUA6_9BACT|nr:Na+/H+ antiporter subunit E [Poriferisphaera corsica]QDU33799.1 Na(+)/H(+) antiporter subunit E1 [Poriferisphaera corsica]